MKTVVLVPRRPDGGYRDAVWRWVRDRWRQEHSEWPIYEGHHTTGRFNASAARNRAAAEAGEWDVALFADADSFVSADQSADAVRVAAESAQLTVAHDHYLYLSPLMSQKVMAGDLGPWYSGVRFKMIETMSSVVAVPRTLWDTVGGYDEQFTGWGYEDTAFFHAAKTLGGGWQRIIGPVWHVWHPVSDTNDPSTPLYQASKARADRYEAASGDINSMRAVLRACGVLSGRS